MSDVEAQVAAMRAVFAYAGWDNVDVGFRNGKISVMPWHQTKSGEYIPVPRETIWHVFRTCYPNSTNECYLCWDESKACPEHNKPAFPINPELNYG